MSGVGTGVEMDLFLTCIYKFKPRQISSMSNSQHDMNSCLSYLIYRIHPCQEPEPAAKWLDQVRPECMQC